VTRSSVVVFSCGGPPWRSHSSHISFGASRWSTSRRRPGRSLLRRAPSDPARRRHPRALSPGRSISRTILKWLSQVVQGDLGRLLQGNRAVTTPSRIDSRHHFWLIEHLFVLASAPARAVAAFRRARTRPGGRHVRVFGISSPAFVTGSSTLCLRLSAALDSDLRSGTVSRPCLALDASAIALRSRSWRSSSDSRARRSRTDGTTFTFARRRG